MGIRLIVEVLDHWKDFGLTAGERGDLIVVAENANDETRTTWGPLHADFILERAGKSANGWKNAIGKLVRKGALEHAVINGRVMAGFHGQYAVYRLAILCSEAPHDGLRGACTRTTTQRVTSPVTQPEEGSRKGHPTGDPNSRKGHPTGAERVTSQVTPSPPSPLTTSPLSVAERLVTAAAVVTDEERETFINWVNQTYQPKGPGWWRAVAKEGDFPDIAAKWRANQAATTGSGDVSAPCTKCTGGEGWIDQPEGGVLRCPDCNPGVAA